MTENKLDEETLKNITPFAALPVPQDALAAGRAMQQVKTEYTTAVMVQVPRVIEKVTKNVLKEAKLAGSGFYFRWMVFNKDTGKKDIPVQGPSIDLAMCIARNYGNCVIDVSHEETATHFIIRATFVDLETGFTVPRLFRQRKSQDIGKKYGDDRSEDMLFQVAQSKAQRNAIIKAVPGWMVDKAIEVARQAELDEIKAEAPEIARAKVMAFFEGYGVTLDRVEAAVDAKVDKWTTENIVDLRGMATGLKEGRVSAKELFPESVKEKTKKKVEELKAKLDEKKAFTASDKPEEQHFGPDQHPDEMKADLEKIDTMSGAADELDRRLGGNQEKKVPCKFGCGTMIKEGATRHENSCEKNPANQPEIDQETRKPKDGETELVYSKLQAQYPNIHPELFGTHVFKNLQNLLISEKSAKVWATRWADKPIKDEETLNKATTSTMKEALRVTMENHKGHDE